MPLYKWKKMLNVSFPFSNLDLPQLNVMKQIHNTDYTLFELLILSFDKGLPI